MGVNSKRLWEVASYKPRHTFESSKFDHDIINIHARIVLAIDER